MDALVGITFYDWMRLLRENRFAVDREFWRRGAYLTAMSLLNSRARWLEERQYGEKVRNVRIEPPLFILGHWRNGTTLLHKMLVLDEQFAYANLFQIAHPRTFLWRERKVERYMGNAPPQKRPMDNMEVTFRSPGEDEGALSVISLRSPLVSWSFPRREEYYDRYLTFRGVDPRDLQAWKDALLLFLRKLTWRYRCPIVLKSPTHTARLRILLEMFPQARFVHICRDPYTVFLSTRKLYDTAVRDARLQHCREDTIEEGILRRYRTMYDAYFAERSLIPAGHFHEMRFEDFEKDIMGGLEQMYGALQLPGFERMRPKFQRSIDSLSGYRKNTHQSLPESLRVRIAHEWKRCFDEWGYPV